MKARLRVKTAGCTVRFDRRWMRAARGTPTVECSPRWQASQSAASTRSFRQAIAQRVEQEPKGAVDRAKRGSTTDQIRKTAFAAGIMKSR